MNQSDIDTLMEFLEIPLGSSDEVFKRFSTIEGSIQRGSSAVQFDRRNGKQFKCYDVGTNEFRSYIVESTRYTEPDRKSFTDIVTLCKKVAGVNLSVGFRNEHGKFESLVSADWQHTLDMCREWLQEPNLPKFILKEQPEI